MIRTSLLAPSLAGAFLALSCGLFLACGGSEGGDSVGDGDGDSVGDGDGDASGGSTGNGDGDINGDGGVSGSGGSAGDGDGDVGGTTGTGPCYDGTCQGVCEGTTCGGEWICNTDPAACTDDLAEYCGCDGVTFTGSGSCPPQAFQSRGACEAEGIAGGKNCDASSATCRSLPAPCDDAFTYREIVNGCWGDCVPVAECGCNTTDQCPDPANIDETFCRGLDNRCSPQLR